MGGEDRGKRGREGGREGGRDREKVRIERGVKNGREELRKGGCLSLSSYMSNMYQNMLPTYSTTLPPFHTGSPATPSADSYGGGHQICGSPGGA